MKIIKSQWKSLLGFCRGNQGDPNLQDGLQKSIITATIYCNEDNAIFQSWPFHCSEVLLFHGVSTLPQMFLLKFLIRNKTSTEHLNIEKMNIWDFCLLAKTNLCTVRDIVENSSETQERSRRLQHKSPFPLHLIPNKIRY